MNILFSCAGRRNYLINYFKAALNKKGTVVATDAHAYAPALKDADIGIVVPMVTDDNYLNTLKKIIKEHQINAIISLNDLELPFMAKHKEALENEFNLKVIISNEEIISLAFDKYQTYKFFKHIGLNTPKTYCSLKSAITAIEHGDLKFPLIIKPRWGTGSLGIEFPESISELKLYHKVISLKLKNSIINKISHTDFEKSIIIQEKISGQEYGLDILNDFQGNYYGTFARKKIAMRSGETDIAESVIDDAITQVGKIISENLRHIGVLDCDLFVSNNKIYILELNPRFGGGYPFSQKAGIDIAAIYLKWLHNETNVSKFNSYTAGIMFSKCARLVRIK